MQQWKSTKFTGVRYREHPTRKQRNGQADRYFTIRYRTGEKRVEEPLGWASEGWTAEKGRSILSDIKEAIRLGRGPKSLAEKREIAQIEQDAEKRKIDEGKIQHLLLREFVESYYIPFAKKTKRTWKTDQHRLDKGILPFLGSHPLRLVSGEDIQKLLDTQTHNGAAPATVKHYMALLRRIYNVAMQTLVNGVPLYSGSNPAQGARIPAVTNGRERFLTSDEADLLITTASTMPCRDLHDVVVLSLNTGLRLGELLRLQWYDVDLTHGFVSVREEEHRKPGGKVPLNREAQAIFQHRRQGENALGLVFPPVYGKKLRGNLSHAFKALVDKVELNEGIPETDRKNRVVFHTLRHTFASWLALAGTDIYRIKTLMRHRSITMTMRYAHLLPDATREAVHNLRPPKKT